MLDFIQNTENQFFGDGVTTEFTTDFPAFREQDVVVLLDDSPTEDFTTDGIGNIAGFTVIFSYAPADASEIKIKIQPKNIRDTDYQLNADITAQELNRDLDRIWQGLQYTKKDIDNKTEIKAMDTWQNLQADLATFSQGDIVYCTDYPTAIGGAIAIGSFFKVVDSFAGKFLFPLAGAVGLFVSGSTDGIDGLDADEHTLPTTVMLPGGYMFNGSKLRLNAVVTSDSNTIAGTFRMYIGENGDSTDMLAAEVDIQAATLTASFGITFNVTSDSVTSPVTLDNGLKDASQPLHVATPLDFSQDLIISFSLQTAATGQVLALESFGLDYQAL